MVPTPKAAILHGKDDQQATKLQYIAIHGENDNQLEKIQQQFSSIAIAYKQPLSNWIKKHGKIYVYIFSWQLRKWSFNVHLKKVVI